MATNAGGTSDFNPQEIRECVERMLASDQFNRAPVVSRFLSYICDQVLAGRQDEIKEYNIGVQALGRRQDFDPQSDPIVRVTAHSLRKRLETYYRSEGRDSSLRIALPVGSYVPEFLRAGDSGDLNSVEGEGENPSPFEQTDQDETQQAPAPSSRWRIALAAGALLLLLSTFAVYLLHERWAVKSAPEATASPAVPMQEIAQGPAIRLHLGGENDYRDSHGHLWSGDRSCHGGRAFLHANRVVLNTPDPALFHSGREGRFDCVIPVPQGVYEVHLLLADTTDSAAAAHRTQLRVNSIWSDTVDVVSDAEGSDRPVVKIITDVTPQSDGAIHIAAGSDDSYLNAIEILPGIQGSMLPLRIHMGPADFKDGQGRIWLSDRYFVGGSEVQRSLLTNGTENPQLFSWERYGHFQYLLPVASGKSYTLTLYFSEGYFGPSKLVIGGPGSRVFMVSCNGRPLLEDFDILREAQPGHDAVTKVFHGLRPTLQGTIELQFQPIHDYALLNALELRSE
jgi:hypothetical protein